MTAGNTDRKQKETMEAADIQEEKSLWILRYTDGTIASCYNTWEKTLELAEKRKDLCGGDYTII